MNTILLRLTTALTVVMTVSLAVAADPVVVRSKQSGPWSSPQTWDLGRLPAKGDQVIIGARHQVTYDVESDEVIRLLQIAGTLDFARDRSTRLNVGLLSVLPSEDPTEEGFDCHVVPEEPRPGQPVPALIVGLPHDPIGKNFTALIRLHEVEGLNKESCPAIICCGGRMEFHGQPIANTWVKLQNEADVGATDLTVRSSVQDWKPGDLVIVTGTKRPKKDLRVGGEYFPHVQTEERRVVSVSQRTLAGGYGLKLNSPLSFHHFASEDYQAEVANLSRNVVVESANPNGERGHTMYHRYSSGSISYAEFRHLGKKDVLGRYSLHYHLAGDTMRGSSVIGASIWDSDNRWLVIHGTNYLTVRDCVGYKSTGHGFFLEDGTENFNILDHNLAAVVGPGKPLPKQVLPFDPNRGAGFWWANCLNSFTRNVAVDCIEYGFRFDNKRTEDFDPHLSVLQPDGSYRTVDTRIQPFIRFEDNEAHTMKFFSLSLRGFTRPESGLDVYAQSVTLAEEAAEAIPEAGHPFWIRNFKTWEAHWGSHIGTAGVFIDGYDCYRADVGLWRSIMDGSGFRRLTMREMRVNDIHVPISMAPPSEGERRRQGGISSFKDTLPPATMITHAWRDGSLIRIKGTVADTSDIKQVTVNGQPARSTRGSFAEWAIELHESGTGPVTISAFAEDVYGHVEPRPHVLTLEPATVTTNTTASR